MHKGSFATVVLLSALLALVAGTVWAEGNSGNRCPATLGTTRYAQTQTAIEGRADSGPLRQCALRTQGRPADADRFVDQADDRHGYPRRQTRLDQPIEITKADRDLLRLTGSRLRVGSRLSRRELLTLALMSSENRAAAALGRTYPGGTDAFVRAMNRKAGELGMNQSRFADAAGLDAGNIASAQDLARMVLAAMRYPDIRKATTRRSIDVRPLKKRGPLRYVNTNRLLRNDSWNIQISKTGYINESGRCLVMHTEFNGTPTVVVLLNSFGKLTPFGDANRVRKWIEKGVEKQSARKSAQTTAQDYPAS